MKIMIEFDLPFAYCEKCKAMHPEKESFYANAEPVNMYHCAYARYCVNAVRLAEEEEHAAD